MTAPILVAPPSPASTKPLVVRLLWMAGLWAAGVACVFGVSMILRIVLHP